MGVTVSRSLPGQIWLCPDMHQITCIYNYIYIYIYIYTYQTYVHTNVHMPIHSPSHTHSQRLTIKRKNTRAHTAHTRYTHTHTHTHTHAHACRWRPVLVGFFLQYVFALFILQTDIGLAIFRQMGDGAQAFLNYANAGTTGAWRWPEAACVGDRQLVYLMCSSACF
jgi:hypothetical protein